jgi:hypothetical protein
MAFSHRSSIRSQTRKFHGITPSIHSDVHPNSLSAFIIDDDCTSEEERWLGVQPAFLQCMKASIVLWAQNQFLDAHRRTMAERHRSCAAGYGLNEEKTT